MPVKRTIAVAVALLATTATAACTASAAPSAQSSASAEPAVGAVPHIVRSVDLRLPVEDYQPTTAERVRIAAARIRLIQKCMADFGIAYKAGPVAETPYGPRSATDRRYGITDVQLAKTEGYGLGSRDPAKEPKPPAPNLGNDGLTALTGNGQSVVRGRAVPKGGCMRVADDRIAATVPADVDLTKGNDLDSWSFKESQSDSRVIAVFHAWSACMARAGYNYTDPMAAMDDPAVEDAEITAQDIKTALADIRCKDETNLVGVWFTVESAYQNRAIARDRAGFDAARAAIATRDKFASSLA